MFDRTDKLVEATMLALQGKLELKENKKSNRRAKAKKAESIDVNVDETTAVSVDNGTTVVETEDATIMITEPEKQPEESIEAPADLPIEEPETVEVPTDDTIMPEEILDEPVDTELPEETEPTIDDIVNDDVPMDTVDDEEKDESKKVEGKEGNWRDEFKDGKSMSETNLDDYSENDIIQMEGGPARIFNINYEDGTCSIEYWDGHIDNDYPGYALGAIIKKSVKTESVEIEVSDDGKEVEVTTDNGEEVEVKDETPDETDDEEELSVPEDGNENIEGEEIIDDEVDECKKITEDVTNYNGAYGYFVDVTREVAQNIDNLNKDTKYQDAIADDKNLELVIDSILDDDELWNTLQETIIYYIDELIAGNLNESKKTEGYIIRIDKDGVDGYWGPQSDAINNNNNVDKLSARIFKSRGAAQREINRYKHEMGNAQIEEIEESKKVEKINKNNFEINNAIANPQLKANREIIRKAGYETDKKSVTNPRNGRTFQTKYAPNKDKIDWKNRLDKDKTDFEAIVGPESDKIPNSRKINQKSTTATYSKADADAYGVKYGPKDECDRVVEDTDYALEPRYASAKSFYGKARVRQKDNGDEELYSYGTHVGGMRNGKPYSKGKFSSTTSRHQAEYFKQKGVDPKKVDVEEGKDCKECDKKLEAFKIKSRAERRAKLEARRAKKTENINDDLGIEEGVPKKEEIVPNAQETTVKNGKVSSKSFTEALTKFFKENYKTIKEVNVSKISQNKSGDLKIEAIIKNLSNKTKDICLEMTKVQSGKSFNKYTLKEAKGLIKESKNDNKKITMMTFNNKNIMECRYLLKK